jgi:diguanylate cyclase (GGDEF)-like protein
MIICRGEGEMDAIIYILLILSTLIALLFSLSILRSNDKKKIHYAVLSLTTSVIIWNVAVILNLFFSNTGLYIFFEQLYFLGPITVSVSILFLGLIYANDSFEFTWRYLLLFIVPNISLILLFTNQYHHLFYTTFSLIPSKQDFGIYFTLHSIVSYIYIGVGLIHLGVFSLKYSGFYSKQSFLILSGILVSLIFDSFSTLKIFDWPTYWENIVFAFSVSCIILAVIKYDFLNIIPIALATVVDSLTDSYVVINDNYEIIDYNKTFAETFAKVLVFKRKESFTELIRKISVDFSERSFIEYVEESIKQKNNISFEMPRAVAGNNYHYKMEIIPVFKKNYHLGTIVLIRDITENKKQLDQITMLNIRLKDLAIKDALTQAYNRYFFDERLQQEIDLVFKRKNYGQGVFDYTNNFGLIIFDIDFFKIFNDNNGHLAGDELLQTLVKVVKSVLFPTDVLCRYGGEEFAIICCETSAEGTAIVAEKIRKAVENCRFKYREKQPNGKVTISVGATYYSTIGMGKDDLIKKADENLYTAKNKGRNTIIFQ